MDGQSRHRDGREQWRGAALNELHGDYLAHERLAERRDRPRRRVACGGSLTR